MKKSRMKPMVMALLIIICQWGCSSFMAEHREAREVTIDPIDFATLEEGTYTGYYGGGMKGWRENSVEITLSPGRVEQIRLLFSREFDPDNPDYLALIGRIIDQQSLQVDAISGATLTTLAHLKAVENALEKAHVQE